MRILSLIFAALILAACQQAGPDSPTASNADKDGKDHQPLRFFEPEFVTLQNQMLVSLADACQSRAAVAASFDRCLRERVTTAFDDSGEGRTHCAFHEEFGDYLDSIGKPEEANAQYADALRVNAQYHADEPRRLPADRVAALEARLKH